MLGAVKNMIMGEVTANAIPQSQPLDGKQKRNNAGGYSYEVDDMTRLQRFLCLGSEKGTYYVGEAKLTKQNAECIIRLIEAGRGAEVVETVATYSTEGRTAKQDTVVFALAMCARFGDDETRKHAYEVLGAVCRIPTTLFAFLEFSKLIDPSSSGWGKMRRKAVSQWYNKKNPMNLAMAVTKYQSRNGWTHRDVLRLAHVTPASDAHDLVFKYAVKGWEAVDGVQIDDENEGKVHNFLDGVETAKGVVDEYTMVSLIRSHGLVREHVPTPLLNCQSVWKQLVWEMPMTALIRNLGKMSSIGLMGDKNVVDHAVSRLTDQESLEKAKVHPFNVLVAKVTYSNGKGDKGKLKWTPEPKILSALEKAFHMAFKCVTPTNKRWMLALDVSGSMCVPTLGSNVVTCREASAAMAMVTARTEPNHEFYCFSHTFQPLNISKKDSLDQVRNKISGLPFGGTDCSLPMMHAMQKRKKVDVFVVYTDSETYFGKIHPTEALRRYRQTMGIDAKLIVVGMASNQFTIADPDDAGMLDVVGFDSNAPSVMSRFALGEI